MAITRRYLCDVCDWEWNRLHFDHADPVPECPKCEATTALNIPGSFSIGGSTMAKAVDYTNEMMEHDYGMTNMRDNLREGDVAAMAPPPVQTAEAEMLTRSMMETAPELGPDAAAAVNNFWLKGAAAGTPEQVSQVAAPAAAAARASGSDPIELLHKAEQATGRQGMHLNVVAKAKAADLL